PSHGAPTTPPLAPRTPAPPPIPRPEAPPSPVTPPAAAPAPPRVPEPPPIITPTAPAIEPEHIPPTAASDMWHDLMSVPASVLKTFDWEQLVGVRLFSA